MYIEVLLVFAVKTLLAAKLLDFLHYMLVGRCRWRPLPSHYFLDNLLLQTTGNQA